ncbi:MAG: rhamnulokinase [Lachnospiraceae bacterium]|nr:rhamnulokinase [Lachnospiraceae bacterium]
MCQYYLAIDIGASSGRHILATVRDGKIVTEEIYRFPNGAVMQNGHLCWDVRRLFDEIKTGLKKCKALGKIPVSLGIDTWAVDFVLLDKNDQLIGDAVAYRDSRTEGMDQEVYRVIQEEDLYARTGIQKQIFNTIYQLMAVKKQAPEQLANAESLLMIPDYFHFLLTGEKCAEYTNATTTQLLNPATKDWDDELIEMLRFPRKIFQKILPAGTPLGHLSAEIQAEVGFDCQVVLPGTHDTASAVLAVPSNDLSSVYISSGTWSLMGIERMEPDCSEQSRELNFTNEGGYQFRYRYLKNIMGLWMIQSLKKELADRYSFAELCRLAEESRNDSVVNCNDDRFLAPPSMMRAIREVLAESGQEQPQSPGDYARIIYRSLAVCYGDTIREIEALTGNSCDKIHVVGGGANADYLNRLIAEATKKTVLAGPIEATAIGNLAAQMLTAGVWKTLAEARNCIYESFEVKRYLPNT